MPFEFEVNISNQNTIKYEVVEDGVWAYIKEISTTRVFGKTEDDACLHLMMLIMNVEDKKRIGTTSHKEGQCLTVRAGNQTL